MMRKNRVFDTVQGTIRRDMVQIAGSIFPGYTYAPHDGLLAPNNNQRGADLGALNRQLTGVAPVPPVVGDAWPTVGTMQPRAIDRFMSSTSGIRRFLSGR